MLMICLAVPAGAEDGSRAEKTLEYVFADGAGIRVHYTQWALAKGGEKSYFARDVLDAAVAAYQTITQFQGFHTPGYAFSDPDTGYAADPDRIIDIYLGLPGQEELILKGSVGRMSFADAPCFDTVKRSETSYDAVILLPANYAEFIRGWERVNPSPLGARHIEGDLRGTLMHEMLHALLFYYNRNLKKDSLENQPGGRHVDWYVEGLARYFETFAGARHDFFSQGFKQTLPDKIRFSRGGANFFMRYPDQAFTELRYENALFWRYLDHRHGMASIERLSRALRDAPSAGAQPLLEKITGSPMEELLGRFALAILLKDFGLKQDELFLTDVASTQLSYGKDGSLSQHDGYGGSKPLGNECRNDWIGRWGNQRARFGGPGVAGDPTPEADVSPWATDFIELRFEDGITRLPTLSLRHLSGGVNLNAQVVMMTRGGTWIRRELRHIKPGQMQGLSLEQAAETEGLSARSIDRAYILITNTDASGSSLYSILV